MSATATEILDTAQLLLQTRGFSGFSYADIASAVGTTKAAIHYHFPSKVDLGVALVARYTTEFAAALDRIDTRPDAALGKLGSYGGLYREVLDGGRLCLCGMLASEHETLPESLAVAVRDFFEDNLVWLERVFRDGIADGSIDFVGTPREGAELVLGSFEGAMLVAWSRREIALFDRAANGLLNTLRAQRTP